MEKNYSSEKGLSENDVKKLCTLLLKHKLKIIADISPRSLVMFKQSNYFALAKLLHIFAYRVDYGLSITEIIKLAKKMPVVVNASTMNVEDIKKIAKVNHHVFAIHNFYPRPETGLDPFSFMRKTKAIKVLGLPVFAFISSDTNRRGPLHAGLPSIELLRNVKPHVSYIALAKAKIIDGVFVGDLGISEKEYHFIKDYQNKEIIPLKVQLQNKKLIGKVFTARIDSPINLVRIKESREYATVGHKIKPNNCVKRSKGSITMDNQNYLRYSGEIMITKTDLPLDKKVNVIGKITSSSIRLLDFISGGQKIIFYV